MKVILSSKATKEYSKLPPTERKKVKKKLVFLEQFPYSGKKLGGELSGDRDIRAWPYRIVYNINPKEKRVEVSKIQHRHGVYK